MAKAGRGDDQYMVRFPKGLRDRIKAKAEENGRSMNSEIVAALEEAFPEGMAMGEFIQTWVAPITVAKSRKEKDTLAEVANQAAVTANSIYRVRLAETPDGRYAPRIVSAENDETLVYIG
mgnify:CR=1 FL=1